MQPSQGFACSVLHLMLELSSGQISTGCLNELPTWQVCICCPLPHQCRCEWWWHWQVGLECQGSQWAGAAPALGWARWKRRRWSAEDCSQWVSKLGGAQSLESSWAWRKTKAVFSYVSAGWNKPAPVLRTARLQQAGAHTEEEISWNIQRTLGQTPIQERASECTPVGTNALSDAPNRTHPSEHCQKPAVPCLTDVSSVTKTPWMCELPSDLYSKAPGQPCSLHSHHN